MAPQVKENPEFAHWLEEWVERMNHITFHNQEAAREEGNQEEVRAGEPSKREAA